MAASALHPVLAGNMLKALLLEGAIEVSRWRSSSVLIKFKGVVAQQCFYFEIVLLSFFVASFDVSVFGKVSTHR